MTTVWIMDKELKKPKAIDLLFIHRKHNQPVELRKVIKHLRISFGRFFQTGHNVLSSLFEDASEERKCSRNQVADMIGMPMSLLYFCFRVLFVRFRCEFRLTVARDLNYESLLSEPFGTCHAPFTVLWDCSKTRKRVV